MIEMSSEMHVELLPNSSASDDDVIMAAQVSLHGLRKPDTDGLRLINYLMKSGHGSPFEHTRFTFGIEAPLFVFQEWLRHRMSSFNQMSGRYTQMYPKFYTPAVARFQTGTPARPEMQFLGPKHPTTQIMHDMDYDASSSAWAMYQRKLDLGLPNEVARTILPHNIYSQMFWTVNARSLMNFLALRVDSPDAVRRTRPQYEIQLCAEQIEAHFMNQMPWTWKAFVDNGRVAP